MAIDQNLENYFKARDLEKLQEFRANMTKQQLTREKEERKKLHWMHCPKCGADMETIKMENLEIDKCPECLGLYFDNQELEQLLQTKFEKRKTFIHKIFGLE